MGVLGIVLCCVVLCCFILFMSRAFYRIFPAKLPYNARHSAPLFHKARAQIMNQIASQPSPTNATFSSRAVAEIRPLVSLATPLVVGLTIATSMMLVDTAMLGPLGELPLAAVSLTTSVLIIFFAGLYGFAGPVGLLAGRAFGANLPADVGRVARHAAVLCVGASVAGAGLMASVLWLLPYLNQPPEVLAIITPYWLCISVTLIPYTLSMVAKSLLDAVDRPWLGVALVTIPVLLNIFFNYLLIYGNWGFPALGLVGAGVATLSAQLIGMTVMWLFIRLHPQFHAWWQSPGLAIEDARRHWHEGLPMSIQYLLEGGAVALAGLMIGQFGATALAGNQIALSVGATMYMFPLGMAAAVSIRISQTIGAADTSRVAPIGVAGLGVVTGWMLMLAITFLFGGAAIARLFVDDAAVISAAASIFFVFGVMQLMDGVQSVSLGALRGMLDNVWPTRVSLIAYWLLALPLAWLIGFQFNVGAAGVWAGFAAGLAVAAVALSRRFYVLSMKLT